MRIEFHSPSFHTELDVGPWADVAGSAQLHLLAQQRTGIPWTNELDLVRRASLGRSEKNAAVEVPIRVRFEVELEVLIRPVG
jgi:hypothetical protein